MVEKIAIPQFILPCSCLEISIKTDLETMNGNSLSSVIQDFLFRKMALSVDLVARLEAVALELYIYVCLFLLSCPLHPLW